jgi:long-chain fatty acid transport protein
LAVALVARPARGAGFSLQDFDGKAEAMSNAFAATANNPSALFFNPAGISQLDGFQGSATLTIIDPHTRFHPSDPGPSDDATEHPILIPAAFGTAEVTDWLYVGLGAWVPYGLSIEWGKTWDGRYVIQNAEIQTMEWNGNVAVKIGLPNGNFLALAAGGSVVTADVTLERAVDQRFLNHDDAQAKIQIGTEGDPDLRWNVAALLLLFEQKFRIGISYRDSINQPNLQGRAEFYNVAVNPVTGQPILPRATHARATGATLPNEFRGGIAIDPIEELTLELDYKFTNWSMLHGVDIKFRGVQGELIHSQFGFDFHDANFIAFGGEWRVKSVLEGLGLRAGVYWDESPINMKALSPALPDNDRLGFSVGAGLAITKNLWVDLAYLAVYIKPITKNNSVGAADVLGGTPIGSGRYETWANLITISAGIKF